jgi:lipoate-protein ligase A
MKLLTLSTHNPYYNLAVEEYLLKNSDDDVIMLWQNEPTVVIGKNQNAFAELNLAYVKEKGIKIARRITGGGAVYHDLGNVNFSFIAVNSPENEIDFKRYTAPIIEALSEMGVKAALSGRNDILVGEKKISGNAQYNHGGRVLHHGTLLFSADFSVLSEALKVDEEKILSKSIKSYRSRVANIKEFTKENYTLEEFILILKEFFIKEYSPEIIEAPENNEIRQLEARNSSEAWIFPERSFVSDYTVVKSKRFPFGTVKIELFMKNEIIENASISGDFFENSDSSSILEFMKGKRIPEILESTQEFNVGNYIYGMTDKDFSDLLNS